MLRVMARRNLGASVHGGTQEELSQALLHLHTVRLDREGITTVKNLELVKEVQSLYLQKNQIKKIENVEVLKNLRFLSLSCNRLEEIRNFQSMTNLLFLDLSQNLIKKLDASELPQSLLILDLTGNPCTKAKDYRNDTCLVQWRNSNQRPAPLQTLPCTDWLETTTDAQENGEVP
ncbi:hypothetical protein GDO78_004368, partial [Eleutherodactylus coqui]